MARVELKVVLHVGVIWNKVDHVWGMIRLGGRGKEPWICKIYLPPGFLLSKVQVSISISDGGPWERIIVGEQRFGREGPCRGELTLLETQPLTVASRDTGRRQVKRVGALADQ